MRKETECCWPWCEHPSFFPVERLILDLPWPAGTSLPGQKEVPFPRRYSLQQPLSFRRWGSVVCWSFLAQKTAENHFLSAELALQQFNFSWLWAWPSLGIFIVAGRRIEFKQVRIRFCAFMILMAVVPWRLPVLWLLCVGNSSWSPTRWETGEAEQRWLKINRVYQPETMCQALRKRGKWLSGLAF